MRDYIIMTDSCCDLTAEEIRELDLTVLPLTYTLDGVSHRNDVFHPEMTNKEFFQKIREGADCSTSAVSVGEFHDAMRPILEAGKDILCVSFSSALSTTYQSACIAAEDLRPEFPEARIIVIDSLSASRGQGMLLWYTAQEKKKGRTLEELADYVRETLPHQCHWFTVDDLNHLKRGGRVSAATALFGTMLAIKPVMYTSPEGKLIPMGKARGMEAALTELVNTMDKLAIRPIREPVFICHADCQDSVDFVKGLLKERFGITDVRADYIGPVIGSHTGCGTLGLFFMGTER